MAMNDKWIAASSSKVEVWNARSCFAHTAASDRRLPWTSHTRITSSLAFNIPLFALPSSRCFTIVWSNSYRPPFPTVLFACHMCPSRIVALAIIHCSRVVSILATQVVFATSMSNATEILGRQCLFREWDVSKLIILPCIYMLCVLWEGLYIFSLFHVIINFF